MRDQQFSTRLKKLRDRLGWSQEHFSEQVGLMQWQISLWESGRAAPTPFQKNRIERRLHDLERHHD